MALCYNFSRVLRIIGLGRWSELLAQRAPKPFGRLVVALLRAYCRVAATPPRCGALHAHPSERCGWASNSPNTHISLRTFLPSLCAFPPYTLHTSNV
jgi:hypothetical protein